MKIIIASDLHGNLEALQSLPLQADYFLIAGDVVDYGPDSFACLELVRQGGWSAVRGNHDQAVGCRVDCGCSQQMHELSLATRQLVWDTLEPQHLEHLRQLPLERYLELGGCRFYLTHAVPGDLYRYLPAEIDDKTLEQLVSKIEAEVIIWGHTHIPYIREVAGKLIINPGSVGQPRDGIPQASWAEWEDGRVRLCRSAYPCQQTIQKIQQSSLEPKFQQQLEYVLTTGKTP